MDKGKAGTILAAFDAGVMVNMVVDECHGRAVRAGWWTNLETGSPMTAAEKRKVVAEKLLLIHSEVSEACEAHRKGLMDDKLTHRTGLEVELADALIRIVDLAGALDLDLGGAVEEKLNYNATRADHTIEARLASGGKAY